MSAGNGSSHIVGIRVAARRGGPEKERAALSAALSLVQRWIGKDSDPSKSREQVHLVGLAARGELAVLTSMKSPRRMSEQVS